jgi:hypothetical protein
MQKDDELRSDSIAAKRLDEIERPALFRAPDAAQRVGDALLSRGLSCLHDRWGVI